MGVRYVLRQMAYLTSRCQMFRVLVSFIVAGVIITELLAKINRHFVVSPGIARKQSCLDRVTTNVTRRLADEAISAPQRM